MTEPDPRKPKALEAADKFLYLSYLREEIITAKRLRMQITVLKYASMGAIIAHFSSPLLGKPDFLWHLMNSYIFLIIPVLNVLYDIPIHNHSFEIRRAGLFIQQNMEEKVPMSDKNHLWESYLGSNHYQENLKKAGLDAQKALFRQFRTDSNGLISYVMTVFAVPFNIFMIIFMMESLPQRLIYSLVTLLFLVGAAENYKRRHNINLLNRHRAGKPMRLPYTLFVFMLPMVFVFPLFLLLLR